MFKELWEADDAAIDAVLDDYGIPSPCEWAKPGSYLQTTIRTQVEQQRRQNDVVLIPVGCTENHGRQTVSAMDTLFVSHLCEAVRRRSIKHHGHGPAIALPPLMYGGHPYHHIGMPGTVMLRESVVEETLVDVMLGLWNDGFRKHDHRQQPRPPVDARDGACTSSSSATSSPAVYPRHRLARLRQGLLPHHRAGRLVGHAVHPRRRGRDLPGAAAVPRDGRHGAGRRDRDEAVHAPRATSTTRSTATTVRSAGPQAEGHFAIEFFGTPEGVVGKPTHAAAWKAKRPVAAFCSYLTMIVDDILATFPAGTVPPVEETTFRTAADMEPFLREPLSEGWKPIFALPWIGQH